MLSSDSVYLFDFSKSTSPEFIIGKEIVFLGENIKKKQFTLRESWTLSGDGI